MTSYQARFLIENDENFIYSKRFNYDINELIKRYPNGAPDRIIAAVLMVTEDDIAHAYEKIIRELRVALKVEPPKDTNG